MFEARTAKEEVTQKFTALGSSRGTLGLLDVTFLIRGIDLRERLALLLLSVLVTLSSVTKIPDRNESREEGLIWLMVTEGFWSILVGKLCEQ